MLSLNHQFPGLEQTIIRMYRKTVPSMVSGMRLDPHKPQSFDVIPFVLVSDPKDFNEQTNTFTFRPSNDVIALYSEREVQFFETQNRALVRDGVLVPYDGPLADDAVPSIPDAELVRLLKMPKPSMKKAVEALTDGNVYRLRSLVDENTEAWRVQLIFDELKRRNLIGEQQ